MPNKKVLGPALIASFGTLFILAAAFVVLRFCGRARAQGNDNDGGDKDVERAWTRHLRGGGSAGTADTALSAGVVEKDAKGAGGIGGSSSSQHDQGQGRGRGAAMGIAIGTAVGANGGQPEQQELEHHGEVERGRSRTRRMNIEGGA